MNFVLLGWLRPVRARNADSMVRLRPSCPTARSDKRICDKRDAQLAQRRDCRVRAAISRNVSSLRSSRPLSSRGHGMFVAASHAAKRSALKVRPS